MLEAEVNENDDSGLGNWEFTKCNYKENGQNLITLKLLRKWGCFFLAYVQKKCFSAAQMSNYVIKICFRLKIYQILPLEQITAK